jgi:hypothetical protein
MIIVYAKRGKRERRKRKKILISLYCCIALPNVEECDATKAK